MGAANPTIAAFNRGRISPLALARTDFKRTAFSAEIQTNWMPRALGSMTLRPGLGYIGATKSNLAAVTLPFIFATDDTARLELTDQVLRVWVDDVLVTRPSVTTTVTNGGFDADITTGWTNEDAGSAASDWEVGGFLALVGGGTAAAKLRQLVTVTDINIRHALNIVIERGPVLIRVGSSAGGDQYVTETTLQTGYHSLAFTPTGNFWIDLFNFNEAASLVNSVQVAGAGTMEVVTPWLAADLADIRWDQSGDVVFCACSGYRQRRIERRADDSWSVAVYQSDNGPFRIQNIGPVTITPSATSGDITLTASESLFRAGHVGALYKLTQAGQSVDVSVTASDQWSSPIRVAGVDATRQFAIIIDGVWSGTVTLQYSVGSPGDWVDATSGTFTTNAAISYDDTLDNQIIYYRIGMKSGAYVSGTAICLLSYSSGTQTGIARVVGYTSSTEVDAAVLTEFGNVGATADWSESYWSAYRGYPSAVSLYEGRLWWAGKDRMWGSVSDSFDNFDDDYVGDAAPISRSIGSGPVDTINWLLPLQRLLLGADGKIRSARSSSLDEPLTVTNFNIKAISAQGAARVNAIEVDTSAVFVQRSGSRVYEAAYDAGSYDYTVNELTQVIPEIGSPGIIKIVAQHQPEKRIHCIRSDGTVALMVFDKQEEVTCWLDIEVPGGLVEDAVVLPGLVEDQVYYTVLRTIDGHPVRYHEKWAMEDECKGFPDAKLADAHGIYSGAAATTIPDLDHLEGEEVVCWGWNTDEPFTNADGDAIGRDLGTFTVTGGEITGLADEVTDAVVGLAYTARYKSSKLAYGIEGGSALTAKKRVSQFGLIARWLHARGLRYGPDFDTMDDLPQVEQAGAVDEHNIHTAYDEEQMAFPGYWSTDPRLCLEAASPRPATVLACVIGMEAHDKS